MLVDVPPEPWAAKFPPDKEKLYVEVTPPLRLLTKDILLINGWEEFPPNLIESIDSWNVPEVLLISWAW